MRLGGKWWVVHSMASWPLRDALSVKLAD